MESLFWCRSAPAASAYKQVRAKWCLCRNVVVNHSYGWGEASEKCSRLVIIQLFFPLLLHVRLSLSLAAVWFFHVQPGLHLLDGAPFVWIWTLGLSGGVGCRRQRWWRQQTGVQTATGGGNNEPGTHQTASAAPSSGSDLSPLPGLCCRKRRSANKNTPQMERKIKLHSSA